LFDNNLASCGPEVSLTGVSLTRVSLTGVSLTGVSLTEVSLTGVHLIHHPKKSAKRIKSRTGAKS
jgi:uncharacterized protein YjbI with pentapeptide repeats